MNKFRSSEMERIRLCAGSWRATKGLKGRFTKAAGSGLKVHHRLKESVTLTFLDSGVYPAFRAPMTSREVDITMNFMGIILSVVQKHGGAVTIIREQRLEYRIGSMVLSGQPDFGVGCRDGTCHIFEYKSGVEPVVLADDNFQGQLYVLMATGLLQRQVPITLHLLAAGNPKDEIHTARIYDADDMVYIRNGATAVMGAAMYPYAIRTPGEEQCRFCPARMTDRCPESRQAERSRQAQDPVVDSETLK